MINQIWFDSLISVLVVSMISLVGVVSLAIQMTKLRKILYFLVSFAAGAMLGDVFLHLLPEMHNEQTFNSLTSFLILVGMITFFILEKIICWRHCHVLTSKQHPHVLSMMNLVGDGVHNFSDGVIIAVSYLVNFNVGLATTLAVIFHEIPHEIGNFSVLLYAGYSRKRAILYNFLSALTSILGAILTLIIGSQFNYLMIYLLPVSAGGFLYIASADFIPELKKEEGIKKSLGQLVSLLAGILIIGLIK